MEKAIQLNDLAKQGYGLGPYQSWITCNGKNIPMGQMISIGCASGRVFTIGFSRTM
ncbi:hypothetical protein B0T22DRAFT_474197 [Podospora appendiculata]|uniref:Uncharacterized protein n=1 Tax=Podospora appendiculata TaxID=314037 RepID=A0AAE1C704_9PEZI|nr:hypothetical protein B0T22DRAFT_474197 [Podospora appendiculata]